MESWLQERLKSCKRSVVKLIISHPSFYSWHKVKKGREHKLECPWQPRTSMDEHMKKMKKLAIENHWLTIRYISWNDRHLIRTCSSNSKMSSRSEKIRFQRVLKTFKRTSHLSLWKDHFRLSGWFWLDYIQKVKLRPMQVIQKQPTSRARGRDQPEAIVHTP